MLVHLFKGKQADKNRSLQVTPKFHCEINTIEGWRLVPANQINLNLFFGTLEKETTDTEKKSLSWSITVLFEFQVHCTVIDWYEAWIYNIPSAFSHFMWPSMLHLALNSLWVIYFASFFESDCFSKIFLYHFPCSVYNEPLIARLIFMEKEQHMLQSPVYPVTLDAIGIYHVTAINYDLCVLHGGDEINYADRARWNGYAHKIVGFPISVIQFAVRKTLDSLFGLFLKEKCLERRE